MSVNETISVNAYFFRSGPTVKSFPKEIEYNNTRYTFNDGLQYHVGKGSRAIRLYDMTDGKTTYRLRQENDTWTLVAMAETA